MQTAIYRKQHAELERIVGVIASLLADGEAQDLRINLAKLSGVLRVHLTIEDKSMYPIMLASASPEVRDTAAEYQRTMGDLLVTFNTYYAKWIETGAIEAHRSSFITETTTVAGALQNRITLENDNLYALIDKEDLVVA